MVKVATGSQIGSKIATGSQTLSQAANYGQDR